MREVQRVAIAVTAAMAAAACGEVEGDGNIHISVENEVEELGNGLGRAAEDTIERANDAARFAANQVSEIDVDVDFNRAEDEPAQQSELR